VILAPTGIAALNARGQTIHSFFRLPPAMLNLDDIEPNNRLMSIVRRLDFLVIDEISMVRADLLDAVDVSLRVNRGNDQPFGGVPVLLVGDFLQLPPIVQTADAQILESLGYESHFAFGAKCLRDLSPLVFELTHVYRQQEKSFIELLGKVRFGEDVHECVEELNRICHRPHRTSATPVILTARNNAAEQHNYRGLSALHGQQRTYVGELVGQFANKDKERLPAPEFLDLKCGSRVMLTKNDSAKRWVNGSLATVTKLGHNFVSVLLDDDRREYVVTIETWESVRYEWNSTKQRVVATVAGKYSQLPLMPAWAITIHKAQGLTLSDVRIDLRDGAFTEGQTYVALSRAKTLDGLSFAKPIAAGDIRVNPHLVEGVKQLSR
jgi:ATP-dependent exoDNAse (exonuclease V) alpha subunit